MQDTKRINYYTGIYQKKLKTSILEISFDGEKIILKPLKDLGGILSEYAMKEKT